MSTKGEGKGSKEKEMRRRLRRGKGVQRGIEKEARKGKLKKR